MRSRNPRRIERLTSDRAIGDSAIELGLEVGDALELHGETIFDGFEQQLDSGEAVRR